MAALLSQIVESLWGLGIPEAQLRGIATRDPGTFRAELRRRGVTDQQYDRARALAEWRTSDKATTRESMGSLLRTMGIPQATINQIIHRVVQNPDGSSRTFTDAELVRSASEALGAQVGTNLAIKLGAPTAIPPGAPTWNPFRGDAPKAPAAASAPTRPGGPRKRITGPTTPEAGLRPGTGMASGGAAAPSGGGFVSGGDQGYGGGGYDPAATTVTPATPAELRAQIEASYGWAAALADEPEVAAILNDYAANTISLDEAERRFRGTNFYRRTTEGERNWKVLERTDPAEAAKAKAAQFDNLKTIAQTAGVAIDEKRLAHLVDITLRYGWSDTQVARFMAAEFKFDPTGQRAGITQTLKDKVRDFLVPLSDATLTSWGQAIIAGTKTEADFDLYLRSQAKSMFPGFAGALDDPNLTTRDYLNPYAQVTASTLGINSDDIDWTEPKWIRAVNQVDDKGNRSVMSIADWQRTLISDPAFGYDQTTNGKAAKADLGRGLLQTLGFAADTGLGR